jgi:hypothetical protein
LTLAAKLRSADEVTMNAGRFARHSLAACGRCSRSARLLRGWTGEERAPGARLRQPAPDAVRAGLLTPAVVEPAGVDGIESQLVDEPHDDGLGLLVVASATRSSGRSGTAASGLSLYLEGRRSVVFYASRTMY